MATIAPESPPALPRSPSLASLISFSVTSNSEKPHSLVTAPCSRCGHAEPIRSLLSVVERTVICCPSCNDNLENDGASKTLQKSFSDLESTLQRHGADLDRLSVIPRHGKLTEIDDGNRMLVRRSYKDDSASACSVVLAEKPVPEHIEYAQSMVPHKSNRNSYNGLPLVHDVDDLRQLTAGVTRLLKTLHDKVTRLDLEERLLRSEREALSKEREDVNKLREMLQGGFGRDGSPSPEGVFMPRDVVSKSFEIGDDYQDERSLVLSRTMSFTTIDYSPRAEWTVEKEQQLADLEKRLVRANKNWSDEQEDVLPMVEQLREERRKAKKLGLSRHTSFAKGDESPRKSRGGSLSFVVRRDSKSITAEQKEKEKKRRGSAGDENKARSGLLRFFAKREAA